MIKRAWLICLVCLIPSREAYAAKGFYWMPHMSYGGLSGYGGAVSEKGSGQLLWGGHYQISPKAAITGMGHGFFTYQNEAGDIHEPDSWDIVVKHRVDPWKVTIFSKTLQAYGQWGGWYRYAHVVPFGKKPLTLYGSGIVLGGGISCEILPRLSFDISYKRLQVIPLFHEDLNSAHFFTFALGFRLW
jgi:hypothetical protein